MKKILVILLFAKFVLADEITSDLIQKNLSLKAQSIHKTSDVLENSWINPLTIKIGQNKNKISSKSGNEDLFDARISLNQDIFRSGGIFYAIDYAKYSRALGLSKIELERNFQNTKAYLLLYQILINDKKQAIGNLYIKNLSLDIKRKQEQYLAGLLDLSFLNDTILTKINQENTLLSLKEQKEKLILEFQKLSDRDYKSIKLPNLKIPTKEQYILRNLKLSVEQNQIKSKDYLAKLTKSQYLPKISINANYIVNDFKSVKANLKDDYYNYGLSFSIPLDIRVFDDIEYSRLEYLIAQNELSISTNNEKKQYEKIKKDLETIDQKIQLTNKNIQIYEILLKQTKDLVEANIKIQDDLSIMQNSLDMRILELEILNLDKNSKKFEFYENYKFR